MLVKRTLDSKCNEKAFACLDRKYLSTYHISQQEALALRDTISCQLSLIEEKCDVSGMACDLDPADRDALRRRTREILHQCYKFGFEYHKELDREAIRHHSQMMSVLRGEGRGFVKF